MAEETVDGAVIDRCFAGLEAGDVDAALACLAPDATVWHGFDRVAHDLGGVRAGWEKLVAGTSHRAVVDVRRAPTPTGFVQQHLLTMRTHTGIRLAWPVCIVVRIRAGRISRIDEYVDRAGHFTLSEDRGRTDPKLGE
ncbi:nuclear transport factor 2 family protein [Nocardia bovistercoris]|uniref:Nuclear transport factor 2 family protein n=1 Tax=Nocardia bovistercoris TaxID=2785916 RepID=A0A931N5F4_9NOCA|nr:nuclear transport factor 2 family protein [Nocardia bovistercoris]MBH0779779.1 nuclear transport factor 2 family protein [Nocardia bovistercoris]